MKDSLITKLDTFHDRFEEISALLSEPEVIGNQARFRDLSREYAELEPLIEAWRRHRGLNEDRDAALAMAEDSDPEMRDMAREVVRDTDAALETLEAEITQLLIPRDPDDGANVFLEVRAGTGGDEAALFAGDLFKMYSRYAELKGWKVETVSASHGEHGGFKEVIARVKGEGVYSRLKFESGAHRVQRVPATESQGRIHTSACTVAVMPEADEVGDVDINPADLRVDTYRSSGAGGRHSRPAVGIVDPGDPDAAGGHRGYRGRPGPDSAYSPRRLAGTVGADMMTTEAIEALRELGAHIATRQPDAVKSADVILGELTV